MDDNRAPRKAVGLLLLVFVLGIALGALGTYLAGGRAAGAKTEGTSAHDRRAHMVEQMTRELALTPEQQKQLEAILNDMGNKYEELHKQIAPQTEQVRQRGREQIRAILTADQQPKFEEFFRRLDEERKKRNNR